MTSFFPGIHSEPLLKVLQRTLRFFAAELRFLDEWKVSDRSGSSKCFNPSEYSVSIWNCTSTLNIELSTEKTDSNYGITVSKKLLDGKHTMLYVPMGHGYRNCIV
jgi:hypothetical protein